MEISVNHNYIDDVKKISSGFKFLNTDDSSPVFENYIDFYNKGVLLSVSYGKKYKSVFVFLPQNDNELRYANRRLLVNFFKENYQIEFPYGVLLGIRPVKLLRKIIRYGFSEKALFSIFSETFLISEHTVKKLLEIYKIQEKYVNKIESKKISLYFSVPFCPSRCSYCSFVSNDIKNCKDLLDPYLASAKNELISKLKNAEISELDCLYIGGGTPASPSLSYIKKLFELIQASIDFSKLKEFTFEGGRPDVLDEEKLIFLKKSGVTRLCINPQTMNDVTLQKIGRKHTVDDFVKIFRMARKIGFDFINTDIILGLSEEKKDDMLNTINRIIDLKPENITVHTLSIKRGSKLDSEKGLKFNTELSSAYNEISDLLKKSGYMPYYLYRQKNISQNLDNIGYSLPNFECLYNIRMMEEEHEILGIGAGSTGKYLMDDGSTSTLINPKNLNSYIEKYKF